MGHEDVGITMTYTRVLNKPGISVKGPLDRQRMGSNAGGICAANAMAASLARPLTTQGIFVRAKH